MMKLIKKISFSAIAFLLVFAITIPTVTFSMQDVSASNEFHSIIEVNEQGFYTVHHEFIEEFGDTYLIFTSLDGDFFAGLFNTQTNRASFFNTIGEPLGYLYVESKEAFFELVKMYAETINFSMDRHLAEDIIRHNISLGITRSEISGRMSEAIHSISIYDMIPVQEEDLSEFVIWGYPLYDEHIASYMHLDLENTVDISEGTIVVEEDWSELVIWGYPLYDEHIASYMQLDLENAVDISEGTIVVEEDWSELVILGYPEEYDSMI